MQDGGKDVQKEDSAMNTIVDLSRDLSIRKEGAAVDPAVTENPVTPDVVEKSQPICSDVDGTAGPNANGTVKHSLPDESSKLSAKRSVLSNKTIVMDTESIKKKEVNIYSEDTGPTWYEIPGNNTTKTVVPKMLPEAFRDLPTRGYKTVREYVGSGLSDEEFAKLEKLCSADNLRTGEELIMPTVVPSQTGFNDRASGVNEDTSEDSGRHELVIVKKHRMRVERDSANTFSKRLKYRGIRLIPFVPEEEDPQSETSVNLIPGQDLFFRVRLYRAFPYNTNTKDKFVTRTRHSVFSRDIVLVGRQKLTELRDRIVCANDFGTRLDLSERIDDPQHTSAKDVFPSGFLFINNVFYVDTRPGCSDISEPIRKWAATKKGLGKFPHRDMSCFTLADLHVKLGHPEVYYHQGNCEHVFTFSEIRLLTPTDPLTLAQYPRHTAISQNQTVYCTTCAEFGAKWIVTECQQVPFDPAFFCDTCLKLYLYKDGKKIGHFKVYSYRGNEINMLKPSF